MVRFGIHALRVFKAVARVISRIVLLVIVQPLLIIWMVVLRPVVLFVYKPYVLFRQRARTFFHAQHRVLAILTHRSSLHGLMIGVAVIVVSINLTQANEVRAEEFAEGSLVSQIFRPDLEETVVTAANIAPVQTRYIDTGVSFRSTTQLSDELDVTIENPSISESGALVKSNILDGGTGNTGIETYVVQGGDTLSSIAAEFDISTKTLLWSNNLSESSVIKPGQTLYVLPVTGVAHTVASGETLDSIASKYEASVEDIVDFNNLLSANDVPEGVELIIPDGEKPAPPAPKPQTSYIASSGSSGSSSGSSGSSYFGGTAGASAAVASGGKMNWPASCRRISQYYGYRHSGIDIDCNFGDAIYAARAGRVSTNWADGYGLQVVITHPDGLVTRYAHLQKVFVSNGQWVEQGQHLGEMGSTGWSTGSHLHFEVIVGGRTVNPFSYL